MAPELAAKRIADLSDDLNLRRMIEFRVLDLVHAVLVVDRVVTTANVGDGVAKLGLPVIEVMIVPVFSAKRPLSSFV
jgi:hypothetical protein